MSQALKLIDSKIASTTASVKSLQFKRNNEKRHFAGSATALNNATNLLKSLTSQRANILDNIETTKTQNAIFIKGFNENFSIESAKINDSIRNFSTSLGEVAGQSSTKGKSNSSSSMILLLIGVLIIGAMIL